MKLLHYDLDLFIELNEQYTQTSTALAQVAATVQNDANRFETAARRIAQVNKYLNFHKWDARIGNWMCGLITVTS